MRTTALLLLVLAPPTAAQIRMVHVGTVDLSQASTGGDPAYIGSNPSAVAWDGTDLYVAGFNNKAVPDDVGIVRVADALGAATFGASFTAHPATPAFRGYSGLDIAPGGGQIAAAFDPGAVDPSGVESFVTGTFLAYLWGKDARGGSGVGFDPGFPPGVAPPLPGVGWTTFGAGRRALQETVLGADVFTLSDGMVILTGEGSFWRDMDYDDATGDVWLREGNNLIHGVRDANNSMSALHVVVDASPDADFVNGQNVAYADRPTGDLVFYNDRSATGPGQDVTLAVRCVRTDGTPVVLDWQAFAGILGNGYHDFSWDAASGTLAVLDFLNRAVYVFSVEEPPSLEGAPDTISLATGGSQQLTLAAGAERGGWPYLVLGTTSGTTPGVPVDGQVLPLNLDAYLFFTLANANGAVHQNTFGTLALDGTGAATIALPSGLNPSLAGTAMHHAYVAFDLVSSPGQATIGFASVAVPFTLVP